MAKNDIPQPEKIADIDGNTSIWRVHVDSLREQDVNARVMSDYTFRTLANNIKNEGSLESLPLCYLKDKARNEFGIISGHHRVRACRSAGIMVIPILVINRELTRDEIVAKQIAHNSLSGYDDEDILRQLYDSIGDINQKLATGLEPEKLGESDVKVDLTEITVEKDFEPIYFLFTKEEKADLENLISDLSTDEAELMIADIRDFSHFSKLCNRVSKTYNVRNTAGIVSIIIKLARERLNEVEK